MTLLSKNEDLKLDNVVDEYKNIYHRTINMKTDDVKDIHILILKKKLMIKIQNLRLVIMEEFLNTNIFLLKHAHQFCLKKFLLLAKLKIQFHGHISLMISMVKKLLKHFMKKNCKRLIKKNLEKKK